VAPNLATRATTKSLLDVHSWNRQETAEAVSSGVPFGLLERFQNDSGLPWPAIGRVLRLPERTLARRRKAGRLASPESDRLVRLAQLYQQAVELWDGNAASAAAWFQGSCRALGGRTPLETAETEVGAAEVEQLLGRLAHGVFS